MEHKFHNHSVRKNSLIEEELRMSLNKIEKQKQEKLCQIKSKREVFRKLHSRQSIKHSLDLDRESSTPSSMTSISPLEIMKDSKRFVSEPNLFARRKLIYERKPTFPFVESNRCLSYRKLQQNGHTSLPSSAISVSLDSGMEFYGTGSSTPEKDDTIKTNVSHRHSCQSSPILAFPIIGHNDFKRKPSRAKMCFYKTMANRVTSEDGWKYLMTNVFKRLNESPYQKGNKEDCHDRKGNLDDIALCRYLRLPVKYQSEDGDHLSSDYISE
jgi:hypothetical protein